MAILICTLLFLVTAVSTAFFGYMHYVKPMKMIDQLASTTSNVIPSRLTANKREKGFSIAHFLESIGNLLPVSPQDALLAKHELIAAGFRSRSAVAAYQGSKLFFAVVLLALALIARARFIESPVPRMMMPIAGAAAGYFLPGFMLSRLVTRRREQIRFALPDVLDLMVVCCEAGCGLDQAILNVSKELKTVHRAVSEELSFVNMEIMAGKSRAEALRNFGRRTGEEEVKKLTAILIQADRFGTSIAEALRTQSEFLRIRRRQEAEERAGKVGVKLVFPIFFFCLPSLVIVTAGPGMLQLFQNLSKLSGGQ